MKRVLLGLAALAAAQVAAADWFGSGDNRFEIPFVPIGDLGNPADTVTPESFSAPLPTGTVDYAYRIAKYEVSEEIVAKVNALSAAAGQPLGLTTDVERGPQKPATGLSWFDAARFVNWLNTEVGAAPAYKFDAAGAFQLWQPGDPGYDPNNRFRNTRAAYFLPSADEWHKAAYYDTTADRYWLYPHGADTPPVAVPSGTDPGTAVYNQNGPADVQLAGGENVNGIVGMAGNVAEFEETSVNLINDLYTDPFLMRRGGNGGWWTPLLPENFASSFRNSVRPSVSSSVAGIRVARVPEPTSGCSAATLLAMLAHSQGKRPISSCRGSTDCGASG